MLQDILLRQVWFQEHIRGPGCDLIDTAKSRSETLRGSSMVSINNVNAKHWTQS
jgi:hypothetical protein